jgi:hypothetical protein
MIHKILILLLFVLTGGAVITVGWNNYFYILCMACLAGCFVLGTRKLKASVPTIKNLAILLFLFLILIAIRGEPLDFGDNINIIIKFFILIIFSIYVATFYSSYQSFYANCVGVFESLLIFSLATFVITNLMPFLLTTVGPVLVNNDRFQTILGVVFTRTNDFQKYHFYRNQSIFWEPGVYSVMLILIYMIKIFYLNQKKRRWLYYICIISSASMGGILIFLILNICRPILSGSKEEVKHKLPAVAILVGIPLFAIVDFFYYYSSTIVAGLSVLFHRDLTNDSSVSTRYQDFYYGFLASQSKLIAGHGQDFSGFYDATKEALNKSKEGYNGGITNSIIGMLYCYGLIFLVAYIIFMFKTCIKMSARYALLIFFTSVAALMLEPMYVSLFMILIYTFRDGRLVKLT